MVTYFADERVQGAQDEVVTLDSDVYAPSGVSPASRALVFNHSAEDVIYRLNGEDPTTNESHLLEAGSSLDLSGYENLTNIKFVCEGGALDLFVTYAR